MVARYWDWQSSKPDDYFSERYGWNIVGRVRSHFLPGEILDYGCGTGGLIGPLLGTGQKVLGVDISQDSLRAVNARFGNQPNFLGTNKPEELIALDKKFPTAILSEVVEHLEEDALDEVFSDLRELIGRNGVLIVTTPNNENLADSEIYCPACDHTFHRWQHVRAWTPPSLRAYVESQGFSVERVVETSFSLPSGLLGATKGFVKHRLLGLPAPHLAVICRRK